MGKQLPFEAAIKRFLCCVQCHKDSEMDAYNRFHTTIFKWESFLLKIVGHDFLSGDFKFTAASYFAHFVIFVCFVGEIYTVIYYDPIEKALAVLVSIITIQVL